MRTGISVYLISLRLRTRRTEKTYLSEEPCDNVSKDNSFVGLVVIWWGRDTSKVPKISLPLVHPGCQRLSTVREMVEFGLYDKDMDYDIRKERTCRNMIQYQTRGLEEHLQ
jgi:hypothetical protein